MKDATMLDETSIATALAKLGYRRRERSVYRAEWSTSDVEQFINLYPFSKGYYLSIYFGLRNKEADAFALRCLKAHTGPLGGFVRYDDQNDCLMRFSLGRLAEWEPSESLAVPEMSPSELGQTIQRTIEQKLFPRIREINTLEGLFTLLHADAEPWPWVRTNGALRIAMLIHLAKRLGRDRNSIAALFSDAQKRTTRSELNDAPNRDPDVYIQKVIEDAFL